MRRFPSITLFCIASTIATLFFSMQVYAEIDVSIFSNNTDYNVDIDEMDDTGTITFSEGDDKPSNTVLGSTGENDEGLIMGSFDIKMVEENSLAAFRMSLIYMGDDWIFGDDVIIKTDSKRYTFEVDRDTEVEDGKIYEMYTLVFSDESIQMIKDIIDGSILPAIRIDGDRKVDGSLLILDADGLKEMYNDYEAAGGLEQDFSMVKAAFPCTIKDLSSDK